MTHESFVLPGEEKFAGSLLVISQIFASKKIEVTV